MRVPDLTRADQGVAHCRRLGFRRKAGRGDVLVDLELEFPIEIDEDGDTEEAVDEIDLPDWLSHVRPALVSGLASGRKARLQHDLGVESLRADLWVIVDGERQQLCSGVRTTARSVLVLCEQDAPRVVWRLRCLMPQVTAGLLIGALESDVAIRVEPDQQSLPLPSSGGPRAEA